MVYYWGNIKKLFMKGAKKMSKILDEVREEILDEVKEEILDEVREIQNFIGDKN